MNWRRRSISEATNSCASFCPMAPVHRPDRDLLELVVGCQRAAERRAEHLADHGEVDGGGVGWPSILGFAAVTLPGR